MKPIPFHSHKLARTLSGHHPRSFFSFNAIVPFALMICSASTALGATQERIQVLGQSGSSSVDVWLETSDRAPDTVGAPAGVNWSKGTGSLHCIIESKSIHAFSVPYQHLEVTGPATSLVASGGMYKLTSDKTINDFVGKHAGADLTLKSGSTIEGGIRNNGSGPKYFKFSGAMELYLLPKDKSGNKTKAGSITKLEFDGQGSALVEGQVHLKDVPLPLVTIVDADLHFVFDHPASGPPNDHSDCPTAILALDLPDIITSDADPLVVSVKNLSINSDFEVTFDHGTYPVPNQQSSVLAIHLAEPANFDLSVNKVNQIDVDHSKITKIDLEAAMILPAKFKSATGGPVTIQNISYKYHNDTTRGMTLVIPPPAADLDILWNNYRLTIPKGTGGAGTNWSNLVLDLDKTTASTVPKPGTTTTEPASWTGLYIKNAKLTLPPSFGSTQIEVKNFLLDGTGVSGNLTVTDLAVLQGLKIPGFTGAAGSVQSLSLSFIQTHLSDFKATGSLTLPDYNGTIGVSIGLSDAGTASVTIDPSTDIQMTALGLVMAVDRGTVTITNGKASVSLTGSITVPPDAGPALAKLAGVCVTFKDLLIDDTGHLTMPSMFLDLPTPVSIKAGPATISVSHIGFGRDDGTWVELSGDVSVADLPVSGSIGFDGLRITKRASSPLSVSFGAIHLDVAVQNVGRLTVNIKREDFPKTNAVAPATNTVLPAVWRQWTAQHPGKTIDVLSGSGSLSLDCFGPSGAGIALSFLAAESGWYGSLDIMLSDPIALGSTPFSLFGIKGGIGHNVIPDKDGAKGVPGEDYNLVPMPPGTDANEWLFVAGARIGTTDGYTMWGDIVLSASFGNGFWIDLDGKLYFLEGGVHVMGPPTNPSRSVHANLHYDSPTKTFTATAVGDFYLPSRASNAIYIHGSLKVLVSPSYKEIRIGQDVADGSPPTFTDPVEVKVGGLVGRGVLILSYDSTVTPAVLNFKTGASLSATFAFTDVTIIKHWVKASGSGTILAYAFLGASMLHNSDGSWTFNGASGRLGLSASIGVTVTITDVGTYNVGAGVSADLRAALDANYNLSASGTASLWATVSGKNYSFSTSFSYP